MTVQQINDTADQFVNQMIAANEARRRLDSYANDDSDDGHARYHELKREADEQQTRLNMMVSVVQTAVGYDWYLVCMRVAHAGFPR